MVLPRFSASNWYHRETSVESLLKELILWWHQWFPSCIPFRFLKFCRMPFHFFTFWWCPQDSLTAFYLHLALSFPLLLSFILLSVCIFFFLFFVFSFFSAYYSTSSSSVSPSFRFRLLFFLCSLLLSSPIILSGHHFHPPTVWWRSCSAVGSIRRPSTV